MKLRFLGTGTSQGIPVIGCNCTVCVSADPRDNRTRTSALLESGNTAICFDTGPDFRQQMLRGRCTRLDGIVYTHQHKDHTAGLDDVRPFYFLQRNPLNIYANEGTLTQLRADYGYIFQEPRYPGVPELALHPIGEDAFRIGDIEILPIPVLHYDLPVLGFRFGDMAYVTDANEIPTASMEKLRNLDVLVLNALHRTEHYSHFNLEGALKIIAELKPKRAFLTHISHLMGTHEETTAELPGGVELGSDGLELETTDT